MSGPLVRGPSGPATNASCVQAVNEQIKEKNLLCTYSYTHPYTHNLLQQ